MPWFRVDDTFPLHRKTVAAGNPAIGLWVRAGAWSMQTLTDGFIPDEIVKALGNKSQADRLVSAGLWDRLPNGYAFHEWDDRQPTADDVKHMSEVKGTAATYGNHVRWHRNRNQPDPECQWCKKEAAS